VRYAIKPDLYISAPVNCLMEFGFMKALAVAQLTDILTVSSIGHQKTCCLVHAHKSYLECNCNPYTITVTQWKHLWCWCLGAVRPNARVYLHVHYHHLGVVITKVRRSVTMLNNTMAWLMTEVWRSVTTLPC